MSDAAPGLRKLAKNRRFEELEAACLEQIEEGAVDLEELSAVLRVTSHRADAEFTASLIWLSLSTFAEKQGPAAGLDLARSAADLAPKDETIREETAGLYRAAHADHPGIDELVTRSVEDETVPLADAMAIADALIALRPGAYYTELGRKEPGRVEALVEDGLRVTHGGEEKTLALAAVVNLVPQTETSFLARAVFEKESLAGLALEDPAKLVEEVLRAHGPELNYRGLRTHVVPLVPGDWSPWWNAARPKVLRSPWIDATGGTQPTLTLRKVALSHEKQVLGDLGEAEPGFPTVSIVLDYLGDAGDHAADEPAILSAFAEVLGSQAEDDDLTLALASAAAFEDMRRAAPEAALEPPAVPDLGERDPAEVVYPIADPRIERSVLTLLRDRTGEDWPQLFVDSMPALSLEVCEWAAKEVEQAGEGELLTQVSDTVMAHPRRFDGALMWIWKTVGAGGLPAEEGGPDGPTLMVHMLAAVDRASRGEGAKSPEYFKLRSALMARNLGIARTVLGATDRTGAQTVKDALDRCLGLSEVARAQVVDSLVETHPKLFVTEFIPWEAEDVIFSTRAGLERRKSDLMDFLNERLPAIARAIGEAAAQGDLSENAEYTAALEERERLTERANALEAELKIAKEIPPEMASGDMVTVGSAIRARRADTGEEKDFLFLGPWDANLEEGIYSYRAPVSQAFMGKKEGDLATVQADREQITWEILTIRNGL